MVNTKSDNNVIPPEGLVIVHRTSYPHEVNDS